MDIQKVKELALANGFKLKEQADGSIDLNAYVYDFANAIEQAAKAQAVPDGFVLVLKEPTEAMHRAGQDMVTFGGGYDDVYKAMIEAQGE